MSESFLSDLSENIHLIITVLWERHFAIYFTSQETKAKGCYIQGHTANKFEDYVYINPFN